MAEISNTPLPGLKLIQPRVFNDPRGYFLEIYRSDQLARNGINDVFVQDNEAGSGRGVLRGLHYQIAPHGQSKLVRVTRGSVFDVAVDIRKESSTYGMWYGTILSAENKCQLFIPADFAHGYLVLEDDTIFNYKCGHIYTPDAEGGIQYDDPTINIKWPKLDIPYTISDKDLHLPPFGKHL
jgi:dTDP-4-dehydrorhamnose 3,5-epimerase